MAKFFRIHPKSGEVFTEYRYPDGFFHLGDPAFGKKRHHKEAVVAVLTEDEVDDLLDQGYPLRMIGQESGQVNLISPKHIEKRYGDVAG